MTAAKRCDQSNLQQLKTLTSLVAQALELEYINQVIGFWHLKSLRFEQAGAYLLRSGLDLHPILCCLFPDLIPPSSQVEKEVEIFADIEQELVAIGSCQDYGESSRSHIVL